MKEINRNTSTKIWAQKYKINQNVQICNIFDIKKNSKMKRDVNNLLFMPVLFTNVFFFSFLLRVSPGAMEFPWLSVELELQLVPTPNHSKARSELHLQPMLQLAATLDP